MNEEDRTIIGTPWGGKRWSMLMAAMTLHEKEPVKDIAMLCYIINNEYPKTEDRWIDMKKIADKYGIDLEGETK